jgi:hypothetical protein
MDQALHEECEAFITRFRELSARFEATHTAWQEAQRIGDAERQASLITHERAIIADVDKVITAFQRRIVEQLVAHMRTRMGA